MTEPGKRDKKEGCAEILEVNTFRMCEVEFSNDMARVEAREKAELESLFANGCTSPCVLKVTVTAAVDKEAKACRRMSGHFGKWVDVEYRVECVDP